MRRATLIVPVALLAILGAGCGGSSNKSSEGGTTTAAASCAKADLSLVNAGQLTIGTSNPAYPPWYGGTPHSPWKVSDPNSGQGYESAVAYAIAKRLGFAKSEVKWIQVPFNVSFAPGPKKFDFDVNQISFTPTRAKAVDFSQSYFDNNQAIVIRKGTKIASAKTVADLKPYKLGAQVGTTSYDTIVNDIKPSKQPAVFDSNDAAVASLKNGQIDGLVVDLYTAFYVASAQLDDGKVLGQFPVEPSADHFGAVLQKGSSLTKCVNQTLAKMRSDGTLDQLRQKWLSSAAGVPVLK